MICVKCGKDKCDETHFLCKNCPDIELPTELDKEQIVKTLKKYQKKLSKQGQSSFYTDHLLSNLQSDNDERIVMSNILRAKEFIATFEIPIETDLDKATEEF